MSKHKFKQVDFQTSQLPNNRFQSFLDCLKNHPLLIIKSGLLLSLFAILLIFILMMKKIEIYHIEYLFQQNAISSKTAYQQIFLKSNQFNLLIILGLMVFGLGISGVILIVRNLIWQEGIFFFKDWMKGIKQNWKSVVLIFFIFGFANFLWQFVIRFGYFIEDSLGLTLAISFSTAFLVLIVPIAIITIYQSATYHISFYAKLKNSFLLFLQKPIKTLLLIITIFSPWSILFIQLELLYFISLVVLFLLVLPVELLILGAYTTSLFDQFINKDYYTSIYQKGIWNDARD